MAKYKATLKMGCYYQLQKNQWSEILPNHMMINPIGSSNIPETWMLLHIKQHSVSWLHWYHCDISLTWMIRNSYMVQ